MIDSNSWLHTGPCEFQTMCLIALCLCPKDLGDGVEVPQSGNMSHRIDKHGGGKLSADLLFTIHVVESLWPPQEQTALLGECEQQTGKYQVLMTNNFVDGSRSLPNYPKSIYLLASTKIKNKKRLTDPE